MKSPRQTMEPTASSGPTQLQPVTRLQSAPELAAAHLVFVRAGRRNALSEESLMNDRIYRLVRPEIRFVRSIEMPRDSLRMN